MEDPGGRSTVMFLLVILVLAGAFFSLCEYAYSFLSEAKVKKQAEEGDPRASRAARLLRPGSRLNASLQTGEMLCWLFSAACVLWRFEGDLSSLLRRAFSLSQQAAPIVAGVLLLLLLALVLLVFARLIPKRIASRSPEEAAFAVAPMVRLVCILFAPFGLIMAGVSAVLGKLFGFTAGGPESVTEEEILLMVDAVQEKGELEESQKEMIGNIFEFEDLVAEDIMTHRTDILGIEVNSSMQEAVGIALREGYSRIPVYEEDIDKIIGILYSKDLLRLVGRGTTGNFRIRDYMRPALYIPESNKCSSLFKTFTSTKTQMAVVVDEYGGTSGIVTMEDLLEEIVGNIQDEYDDDEDEIITLGDHVYVIDGLTGLDDVEDLLRISFEEEGAEDYDTLGGFIIHRIGRIPTKGDRVVVQHQGYRFTVLSVKDRRILKVRAEKLPEEEVGAEE